MLAAYILRLADCGRQTAIVEQGLYRSREYSYAGILDRSLAFAAWLRVQGLRGPVILYARPGGHWAIHFYGCVLAGVTVVPIDAGFSRQFVERIAAQVRPSLILSDAGGAPDLASLPAAPHFEPARPAPDSLAEIVYTSGTTAEPRGVMITHGNLLANLQPVEREIAKYRWAAVPFRPLRFLHLIPLSHLFGQVMGLFIPQMLRGAVIFPDSQAVRPLVETIRRRRVSVMVSVPQQLAALGEWARGLEGGVEDPGAGSVASRWWRHRKVHRALGWKMWAFVVGGAALPPAVEKLWRALGYAVIQGYGLTETAPAITITHPFQMREGSVGRKLAGAEIRVAEDGEILVRGPNVSPGYFQNEAATAAQFQDGWLRTGDLGRFDDGGNLIFLGRKKDVIVLADGLNVYPGDVEQALLAQPGVRDAAVVGKDASGGAQVHAVLIAADGGDLEAVVRAANQRLEAHQQIRGWSEWPGPALPRTVSTQKLQRGAIAAWVNGQAAPAPAGESRFDWRQFVAERAGGDLGSLSSLDRVELLTRLEAQGCAVDEEVLARAATVEEMQQALRPARAAAEVLEPRWPRSRAARSFRPLVRWTLIFPLQRIFVKLGVTGRENLPPGPLLLAANHQSILDVPVILRALPWRRRGWVATAAGWEFHSPWRLFLTRLFFHTYPITADAAGAQSALRHAGALADEGFSTLIFPEGRRTPDGRVHEFRAGIGVLAASLRLPVVPVRLDGLYEIWPAGRWPRPGVARVTFGPPLWPEEGESAAGFTARLAGVLAATPAPAGQS